MIAGVGADMVRVERMEKSLASEAFWQRVFGAEERAFLEKLSPARKAASAAANFAAKEAFLKACGKGLGGFALAEIQVLREKSGAPYYALRGAAAAHLADKGLALACAVLEKS